MRCIGASFASSSSSQPLPSIDFPRSILETAHASSKPGFPHAATHCGFLHNRWRSTGYAQAEESQLAHSVFHLKSNPECPDVLERDVVDLVQGQPSLTTTARAQRQLCGKATYSHSRPGADSEGGQLLGILSSPSAFHQRGRSRPRAGVNPEAVSSSSRWAVGEQFIAVMQE